MFHVSRYGKIFKKICTVQKLFKYINKKKQLDPRRNNSKFALTDMSDNLKDTLKFKFCHFFLEILNV